MVFFFVYFVNYRFVDSKFDKIDIFVALCNKKCYNGITRESVVIWK